jgi:hypothetical protein
MFDCEVDRASQSDFCSKHRPHPGALGSKTGGTYPELFPMFLLEAEALIAHGEIPRFDNPASRAFRKRYAEIHVSCSLNSRNPLCREGSLMPMKKCVFTL